MYLLAMPPKSGKLPSSLRPLLVYVSRTLDVTSVASIDSCFMNAMTTIAISLPIDARIEVSKTSAKDAKLEGSTISGLKLCALWTVDTVYAAIELLSQIRSLSNMPARSSPKMNAIIG